MCLVTSRSRRGSDSKRYLSKYSVVVIPLRSVNCPRIRQVSSMADARSPRSMSTVYMVPGPGAEQRGHGTQHVLRMKPRGEQVYEERVTLWRTDDLDTAIRRAETEADGNERQRWSG